MKIFYLYNVKIRGKISAYFHVFFEYKRMRLFLSVYSNLRGGSTCMSVRL